MGYLSGRCEPAAIQHRKVSTENSKNDMIVEEQVRLSNLRLFHHFSASATGKWQRFRKLSASLRCCKGILTTSVLELHPGARQPQPEGLSCWIIWIIPLVLVECTLPQAANPGYI